MDIRSLWQFLVPQRLLDFHGTGCQVMEQTGKELLK